MRALPFISLAFLAMIAWSPRAALAQNAQFGPASGEAFFDWVNDFAARAMAQGVPRDLLAQVFNGMRPDTEVLRLDGEQSEFVRPIWEYLDSAVSARRITEGRALIAQYDAQLRRIERRYGVPREILVAIWGIETSYGGFTGTTHVPTALASLAWEGRRRDYFEQELLAAFTILQSGDIAPEAMRGSWAGAMGHTQFMPSSFLAHAVDFNGDGRRDIWGDPMDALASSANYLRQSGWVTGQPWAVEILLPQGFDYQEASLDISRTGAEWRALGLRLADGAPLPDHGAGRILLPAGARGVALMVYDNYNAIARYNPAMAYVMGVGHLADRIAGRSGGFRATWPRGDHVLTRSEREELQILLNRAGFDTQGIDGRIGPRTVQAIRAFQISRGLLPDGYASADLLGLLRGS